jgi:hypothetical protein
MRQIAPGLLMAKLALERTKTLVYHPESFY